MTKPDPSSPLISIITPVYNSVGYIRETIESVIHQTYKNIQYIIIDGGSTDGTIDIIKEYRESIDYWISEPDKGMYDALVKGLSRAKGDIIGYINAGDYYHKCAFSVITKIFSAYPDVRWLTAYSGHNLPVIPD